MKAGAVSTGFEADGMSALTIYECPSPSCTFKAAGPGRCRSHPYPSRAMGPEMVPVRVFREEDVRPLWEAASEVYEDSGMWKQLRGPLRDFPAPDDWRTP